MKNIGLKNKLLLGRLLTRSGDQAWDFAVPLTLLYIFPSQLRWAAFYYLLVRLSQLIFLPRLAKVIDRAKRITAIRLGLGLQAVGVSVGALALFILWFISNLEPVSSIFIFIILVGGGLFSALGSSFTEIAIANDLVPASIPNEQLPTFNSRLRQVDLFTEVTAPVAAGLLLTISIPGYAHGGFLWIVIWNLASFIPEYLLLASVLNARPDLNNKLVVISRSISRTFGEKILMGWNVFFKIRIWPAVVCYALLWFSVLSPHGVLLTAFLKDAWNQPEWIIGFFRGSGAFFGLAATFVFPIAVRRFGLIGASRGFLFFQAASLVAALYCFHLSGTTGQFGFLLLILLSRIGLYGFSLGEIQIRQEGIPESERGEMNGFAGALTSAATLTLFTVATFLPTTTDFHWLILVSVTAVIVASLWFAIWSRGRSDRL